MREWLTFHPFLALVILAGVLIELATTLVKAIL